MTKQRRSLKKRITRSWPMRTLSDFVLWAIVQLKLSKYQKKYPHLIIRKNTSDLAVFRSIFLFQEFKLPIINGEHLTPKLIVDLGAYTGLSALYYSEIYPNAKIICVEPENSNFQLLEHNTKKHPNIKSIHAGIWTQNGRLILENPDAEKWSFSFREAKQGEKSEVNALSVHAILEQTSFSVIDILKIDIEGAEKQLFAKNTQLWINKVNVIVIELHDRYVVGCSEAFYRTIDKNIWQEYKSGEKVVLIRRERVS